MTRLYTKITHNNLYHDIKETPISFFYKLEQISSPYLFSCEYFKHIRISKSTYKMPISDNSLPFGQNLKIFKNCEITKQNFMLYWCDTLQN